MVSRNDGPELYRLYFDHFASCVHEPELQSREKQRFECERQILLACVGPSHDPIVYIASPYTLGNQEENVHRQIDVAEQLVQRGYIPFWPLHSHYWHEVYPHPAHFWLALDLAFLLKCDYVLRLDGESAGGDLEVFCAKQNRSPVFYDIEDLP
jgi:hypothetical protein